MNIYILLIRGLLDAIPAPSVFFCPVSFASCVFQVHACIYAAVSHVEPVKLGMFNVALDPPVIVSVFGSAVIVSLHLQP